MMSINPRILEESPKEQQKPLASSQASVNSRSNLSFLTIIKAAVSSSLERVFQNTTMKVELQNEKEISRSLQQLIIGISELRRSQRNIQIGKGSLSSQKIDTANVSNLDALNLQNVDRLALSQIKELHIDNIEQLLPIFKQLDPILKSIQGSEQLDQKSVVSLDRIFVALNNINKTLSTLKPKEVSFPIEELTSKLDELISAVDQKKIEVPPQKDLVFPEFPKFPKTITVPGISDLQDLLEQVSEKLDKLPTKYPEIKFPREIGINNFPPQKIPQPVTNININPLKGTAVSNAVTVGTSATPLPATPLANRRSMIIFNNGSGTIYIGGSNVTAANGMPIPSNTYSPALDAAANMIIYGISGTGSQDIRTLEVSSETIPGHTVI